MSCGVFWCVCELSMILGSLSANGWGSCLASSLAWGVYHWSMLVIEWSWVLALRWRSLGELLLIDIMWGQEASGGPMSWTRLSHFRGSGLTPGQSTKTLSATRLCFEELDVQGRNSLALIGMHWFGHNSSSLSNSTEFPSDSPHVHKSKCFTLRHQNKSADVGEFAASRLWNSTLQRPSFELAASPLPSRS